jgi:hypothetical protein
MGVTSNPISRTLSISFLSLILLLFGNFPAYAEEDVSASAASEMTGESSGQTAESPDTQDTPKPTDSSEDKDKDKDSATASMSMMSSGGAGLPGGVSLPIPENFQFTGAATIRIPIAVPPGRNGMQPNLSLFYNSYQKNGWIGLGWSLDIGSIERSTKYGVNYAGQDFVVSMNGSTSELVDRSNDWGSGYYGAKIEDAFSKYHNTNPAANGWLVTAKNGTKYYYGTTSDSRQDFDNGQKIFKWCLDRVEDTNGNYMTVTYTKDQGEIYLDRIDYTYGTGLTPGNHLEFKLDAGARTDAPSMYTSNFQVKTAKRLKTIEVYADDDLVRKYELQYSYSGNTGRSLLSHIIQYGSDGVTYLPAISQEYFTGSNSFDYSSLWSTTGNGVAIYPGDYNGDGRTDFMRYGAEGFRVFLSTGVVSLTPSGAQPAMGWRSIRGTITEMGKRTSCVIAGKVSACSFLREAVLATQFGSLLAMGLLFTQAITMETVKLIL